MSENPPERVLEFFPGDEIKLRVSFTSSSNVQAVEAVYAHPRSPWITLTLEGEAEPGPHSPTSGPSKRTIATLSGVAELQHMGAVYEVAFVVFYTFGGLPIPHNRRAGVVEGDEDADADHVDYDFPGIPGDWPKLAINTDPLTVRDVEVERVADDEP